MAFVFSLASVLALRRQREQAEERALTAVLGHLHTAHATLRRLDAELASMELDEARCGPHVLDLLTFRERYARKLLLRDGRAELLKQIESLDHQRVQRAESLRTAMRDRETLSELEAQGRRRFDAELAPREQRRSDDLFLSRLPRRSAHSA